MNGFGAAELPLDVGCEPSWAGHHPLSTTALCTTIAAATNVTATTTAAAVAAPT